MNAFWKKSEKAWSFPIILGLAAVIRLIDLPSRWLWYDELQSVTHSILPVGELLKSVRTFDPHPPLYYLQLHFWMSLGTSDGWIKLNSVIWSLLTLIMIYCLGKDMFSRQIALLGALVFALIPFAVIFAQEARMYAMLMCLGIGSFYFSWLYVVRNNRLYLPGVVLFALAFLYSHGAGFMILVSLSAYAGLVLVESRFRNWKVMLEYGLALLGISALYIPWLRIANTISVGHTLKPSLENVMDTLFIMLGGYIEYPAWLERGVVIVFAGGAVVGSLRNINIRAILLAFVVAPIAFCILISVLSRPIWLYRTLAYLAPFWSLIIAALVIQAGEFVHLRFGKSWLKYSFRLTTLSLLGLVMVRQQTGFSYVWRINDAVEFLQSAAQNGDVIYVPNERLFWGVGWYLAGPGSVNPLQTNYSLVSSSGVKIISRPAMTQELEIATDWIVYRSIDDISPFSVESSSKDGWDFSDMTVIQVRQ
jgi:uncharacterized membrane protein